MLFFSGKIHTTNIIVDGHQVAVGSHHRASLDRRKMTLLHQGCNAIIKHLLDILELES